MLFLPIDADTRQTVAASSNANRRRSLSRKNPIFGRRHESQTEASINKNSFGAMKLISAIQQASK